MSEMVDKRLLSQIPLDDKGFLLMSEVKQVFLDLLNHKQYHDALNYLNFIKNKAPLKSHENIIKLHNLYIEILLEIEDYGSLENILKSKKKYLDNPKDKNMHYFYMAICYEGLDQTDKAIKSLESIEDILSSHNLCNKYLKLSILYAQQKKLKQAKECFDHALVFDRNKENHMFLLAESDILYQEGKLHKAIQLYEDFFIKSKRKLSYLNRFIRISIALNRVDDAYDFFIRHKEQVLNSSTIQSKISFLQEALPILKDINPTLYIDSNNQLEDLNNRTRIHFDDVEYFQVILNQTQTHKIYDQDRDLYRDFLLSLDQTKAFMKMQIIHITDAKAKAYHYSKTLLLEKELLSDHLIIDDLINHKANKIYRKDLIQAFVFVTEETEAIFVEAIDENTYFLGYTNKDNYDLARKLSLLSSGILKEKLNHFSLINQLNHINHASASLMNDLGIGLVKIHNNHLVCLNDKAKEILSFEKEAMPFSEFQKAITPHIYMDDLIHHQSQDITYDSKNIHIQSFVLDLDIYLAIDQVIEEKPDVWQASNNHSLIMLSVFNHIEVKKALGYDAYVSLFKQIESGLNKATNNHLIDYCLEGDFQIILRLDNRDKRIFERLDKKIKNDEMTCLDIRYAYHHFNHDYLEEVYRLNQLITMTDKEHIALAGDLPIRKSQEKNHLYIKTVKKLIEDKRIILDHSYIKDWTTQKVVYIDIDYSDLNILKDPDLLKHLLKTNHLDILFDRLIINQTIIDSKHYHEQTNFILPISLSSIESKKAFNYLLRRLQMLKNHHFTFKLSINDYLNLSLKDKAYLKEKEIHLCIIGAINHMQDIIDLPVQSMCMIQSHVFKSDLADEWVSILKKRYDQIIYNHGHDQLLRTHLERLCIKLIKGEFSGYKQIEN